MEDDRNSDAMESEEIPDAFLCCICLELLYKPVVLACGHVSCFWCVHFSMNPMHASQCPICRHPYYHFPAICEMLHSLLLKMYPDAYEKRRVQTLEKEKKLDCFSPEFGAHPCKSQTDNLDNHLNSKTASPSSLFSGPQFTEKEQPSETFGMPKSESVFYDCGSTFEYPGMPQASSDNFLTQHSVNEIGRRISISDVTCAACKHLLFHPAVLNCGHVFCGTCISLQADGRLRCPVCQSPEPRGIPKLCLMLDQFLIERFPDEYAVRRDILRPDAGQRSGDMPSLPIISQLPLWSGKVHIHAGCDSCGMKPIIGDRYKCCDCGEKMGFDLCGDCYNTQSKLPGRFNQQHTPEHKFVKILPWEGNDMLTRAVSARHLNGDAAALIFAALAPENRERGENFVRDITGMVMRHLDGTDAVDVSYIVSEEAEHNSTPLPSDVQGGEDGFPPTDSSDAAQAQNDANSAP